MVRELMAAVLFSSLGCDRGTAPQAMQVSKEGAHDGGQAQTAQLEPVDVPESASQRTRAETKPADRAVSDAQLVAEACALLAKDPSAAPIPGTKAALCQGKVPRCHDLDEQRCPQQPLCFARRGSGSGEGCVRCTPDITFWRCEPIPGRDLAKRVLQRSWCAATSGTWSGFCDCGSNALLVDRRGCVAVSTLCAEAGGEWVEEPANSVRNTEFLPLSQCQARAGARWEPPPHPPVGVCEADGVPAWLCDQAQREDATRRKVLKAYRDQTEAVVLCTSMVRSGEPRAVVQYRHPTPLGTTTFVGSFCRKDGRQHPFGVAQEGL